MGRERWNAEKGESKNREGEEDKGKGGIHDQLNLRTSERLPKGDGREKRNRARRKVDRPILISKSRRLWSQALPADNVCVSVRVCDDSLTVTFVSQVIREGRLAKSVRLLQPHDESQ